MRAAFVSGVILAVGVLWSDHAQAKAVILRAARRDIEEAVIEHHDRRQSNPGPAAWRLTVGPWVILYDHPDRGDPSVARVVTLWRHR